jgi:hypothetical protein
MSFGGIYCPDQALVCDVNPMALRKLQARAVVCEQFVFKMSAVGIARPSHRAGELRQAFKIGAPIVRQAGISSAAESWASLPNRPLGITAV